MVDPIHFCVDAGATRSRGRLYDGSGRPLAHAEGGPANASYDGEQAIASVLALWTRLNAAIGRDPADRAATMVAIGGAGLYIERARDALVARLPGFASVVTMSDGYAAMIGAGLGAPCGLITIGTGVAGHRLFEDGRSIQRDAWGWIVGDRGGGVWLGTRAVRHMATVRDGLAEPTLLSRAVLAKVDGVPGLRAGALSNLDGRKLASFAPLVLETARAGCPVADAIMARAARHLADLASVLRCDGVPLFLNGGLAEAMKPRLVAATGRAVQEAESDALAGCLMVARGEAPPERTIVD